MAPDLGDDVGTVAMEIVGLSVEGGDVRPGQYGAGTRTVFLNTAPTIRRTDAEEQRSQTVRRLTTVAE